MVSFFPWFDWALRVVVGALILLIAIIGVVYFSLGVNSLIRRLNHFQSINL